MKKEKFIIQKDFLNILSKINNNKKRREKELIK